jgi:hypothetical protein
MAGGLPGNHLDEEPIGAEKLSHEALSSILAMYLFSRLVKSSDVVNWRREALESSQACGGPPANRNL